ncbi:MAG: hypothetical protein J7619_02925 [Dyadobacter sp.]|uniref:hypothetical protein n=1 Tax=Dyadobacter sp. TaxID=1914288 RepID=UPI001B25D5B8|nr:hypothetical protein [Dyadobacter sp.]MBO9611618.1 hypothetical protein [Dyadobacter sp.]
MKRYNYILILLLSGLLSCEKHPPLNPRMVNQFITGEVNGVPFKSAMTVEMGAYVNQEWCDKVVIDMGLIRKISEEEYQVITLNYFHAKPGNYVPTDTIVRHKKNAVCSLDSINISSYFQSFPGNDVSMDTYRLVEGPWNYFKVLYYDPDKNEVQGQFAAKFVRINKHQRAKEAADTITYTNGKFTVSNMYVLEVFTEPR